MAAVGKASGRRAASCFFEVRKREIGSSSSRASSSQISGSEGLILRMSQYGKLRGHSGCVNTVSFNPAGDLLVSGSDDTDIILWDWLAKTKKLTYPSGHQQNVFHARVMPFTDDSTIVTVAADGQVRVGQMKQGGEFTTKQIGEHHDRAHKMALEPGSPHILYSCGEDGLVQHFDLRSDSPIKLLTCYSFSNRRRRVRLNTIAIDPQNPNYFSIGGSDEYVRLYDFRKINLDSSSNMDLPVDTFCPKHLLMGGKVHVTSIAYSYSSEILVSYNDELIYLFQNYMGLGPNPESTQPEHLDKLEQLQSYSGHRNFRTVKGVSFFGPNNEYVLSGSDCGHVFIWRKKGGKLMRMMRGDKYVVNCIEPHPHFPFLATSGIDKSIKTWTPSSSKVMPLPQYANQIIASNEREREAHASQRKHPLHGGGGGGNHHTERSSHQRRRSSQMDSGSESDGAPEELTAVQGVEKHEEISKVEKDSAVRATQEEKDRRKRWAQRKTSSNPKKKKPLKVEDKDTEVDEETRAMPGTLPKSVIEMLAAREKQTFTSDSEEENVSQKVQKKKKRLKTTITGPETILLKDVRSTEHIKKALEFLNHRKNQVPRSNAVLKNRSAMRLFNKPNFTA